MTCLVVDESATMRRICRRALEAAGCETVLEAGTRAEADEQSVEPVDLVITGRSLPDGDVLSFVSALRAAEATATVPVLMISDLGQRAAVVAATEAGVSSYLLRPFMLSALQSRIAALLGPDEGARGGADVAPAAAETAAEPETPPEAKAA